MLNLFTGNCNDILKSLPSESVQCIITSPPYFNLRDYHVDGQLGQEKTPDEYIANLMEVITACKRVLKNDGCFFLNIADSYNKKTGSLNGVPQKLFTALLDHNWIIRNEIIWYKRNAFMKHEYDRFGPDFEHIYFFVKNRKYKFNTQYEPMKTFEQYLKQGFKYNGKATKDYEAEGVQNPSKTKKRILEKWAKQIEFGGNKYPNEKGIDGTYSGNIWKPNPSLMRIKRCVWDITVKPFKGAHFATFPKDLVEIPIQAATDERDVILDPFMGSGTVGVVASRLYRSFIGIDMNPKYVDLAISRLVNHK